MLQTGKNSRIGPSSGGATLISTMYKAVERTRKVNKKSRRRQGCLVVGAEMADCAIRRDADDKDNVPPPTVN